MEELLLVAAFLEKKPDYYSNFSSRKTKNCSNY